MRTSRRAVALILLAQVMSGCESQSPSSPSPATQPVSVPSGVQVLALGSVADTAFRPLAGARVEVVDGPDAGMSTIADAAGRFGLTGRFDDTTLFRATREGYLAATKPVAPCCATSPSRALFFFLAPAVPSSPSLAGEYTLTFAADGACPDLPNEARTRTYNATLAATSDVGLPANSWLQVTFGDRPFFDHYDSFLIGVAGDFVAFNLNESEGPYLVEVLAPNTYLAIGGVASTTVGPAPSTISASLVGTIEYCKLSSPMGPYYSCTAPVAHARCFSSNHRLTLTRQ